MSALFKHPDTSETDEKAFPNPLSEPCRCPGAGYFSDRMLEVIQTDVIFFDADGIIYRINSLARTDLRTTEELVGRKIDDLLSVVYDNRNILPELIARLDEPETDEVKLPAGAFMRCNDRKVQFFVRGSISQLECGRYLFSFRNIMDEITREQILSMALARTRIFPWFYDMERDKMLIDSHWFSYLNIPTDDCTMTNEAFFSRVHPDEREMLAEALQLQLSDYEIQDSFEYRLQRGDGEWEWFSAQSMYLSQADDGSPYRVVGVCQSIQDHKTVEDNLRAARDKAQESDRLKSAFLANMSHEIRTPLNAIVGFSNLLANGEVAIDSEEGREYVTLINKNSDYLLTLVSDILDLSRIETGTMEYSFAEQSLGRLLSDIYENNKHTMPEGVEFNLLLPPEDIQIETDALRLRQVVNHLICNAVKFTDGGHIDIGYSYPAEGCTDVSLFVADTGRGITAEQAGKIFDRFYKGDSFMQGAGLGLSVCKTIIESLGGSIAVSSRPQKGSRFTVQIPLRQQDRVSPLTH